MIHSVRFRNFKALRDVELGLERFTVLVGPNAAGKSSVLEGLHHLTRLAAVDPRQIFRGPADVGVISSRGAQGVFELGFAGSFRGKRGSLSISFAAIEDYPFTDTYLLESQLGDRRYTLRREFHRPEDEGEPFPEAGELPLSLVMREATFLALDRRRLAEPAYSDLPTAIVSPDGAGLAAALADMAISRPDDFVWLQDALRAVIPGFVRVRMVRAKVERRAPGFAPESEQLGRPDPSDRPVWGHEVVIDMKGAADIPARVASEGTLLLLGLFTTLIGSERQQLVLIDHLERAVSPRGMGAFISQLYEVLSHDPKIQIVATSDSPVLVDAVRAEEVRVHAVLPDGSVAIAGLHEHPGYEVLRADLPPGQFWREVGEDWVEEVRKPSPPEPPPSPAKAAPTKAARPAGRAKKKPRLAPAPNAPPPEAPSKEAPSRDAPSRDAPSRDAPSRDAPSKDAPPREAAPREAAPSAPSPSSPHDPLADGPPPEPPAEGAPLPPEPPADANGPPPPGDGPE